MRKKKATDLKKGDLIWMPLESGVYLPNPLCLARATVTSAKQVGSTVRLRTREFKEVGLAAGSKVELASQPS